MHLPQLLAADPRRCRDGVEAAWQFAAHWQGRATESDFAAYLWPARPDLAADPALRAALFALTEDLRRTDLVDRGAQGLQSLQAAYGPLLLRGRFDLLVTAPPRLTLGELPDAEYGAALRDLASQDLPAGAAARRRPAHAPSWRRSSWSTPPTCTCGPAARWQASCRGGS